MQGRALERIRAAQPDVVIMGGDWPLDLDFGALAASIEDAAAVVRAAGAGRVVVMGPLPIWRPSLASSIVHDLRQNWLKRAPAYVTWGLDARVFSADARFREVLGRAGVDYVSATDQMCVDGACRAWVDEDTRMVPTSVDYGHLTPEASRWLVERVAGRIFAAEPTLAGSPAGPDGRD